MTGTANPPGPGTRLLIFLAGVVLIAGLLFSVHGIGRDAGLTAGEPSPATWAAPVDLQVTDEIATQQQRLAVREQVQDIYSLDAGTRRMMLATIQSASLPEPVRTVLMERFASPAGVRSSELPAVIAESTAMLPAPEAESVGQLLERRLLPTSVVSSQLTEAARNAAANAVPPILSVVPAGQPIVREGDILTASQLSLLQATGLYSERAIAFRQTGWIVAGSLMIAVLMSLVLGLASSSLMPQFSARQLVFVGLVTIGVALLQRLGLELSSSLLLVSVLAMLMSALVSMSAGIVWGVWAVIVTTLMVPGGHEYTMVTGLAGVVVAARLTGSERARPSMLVTGVIAGLASAFALVALSLLLGGYTVTAVIQSAGYLVLGGAAAGLLTMALLPIAEGNFGFVTYYRLLELSNPNSPLLQRLLLEAPGTYQHSLIISNLVDQAVQRIGGDALLARVGALYHDVGKLKRPGFFVENQMGTENPHDRLSPHLSYLIITAHVRDGVELIREYNLPAVLEEFVSEHHGTTILSYFYKRALEDTPSLDELSFRYPGPKPQSKETAVLMLADAIESASRTITDASPGAVRVVIERIVDQRLRDGQLNEANLNFDDLETIKDTFERMLGAILHRRIAYPTAEEIGRLKRNGGSRQAGAERDAPVAKSPVTSTLSQRQAQRIDS